MNRLLPLDIAPDLTLTIGGQSTRVTPQLGMRLAESLLRVSARAVALEERERAEAEADRCRQRFLQQPATKLVRGAGP